MKKIIVSGAVQGVGFRYFVSRYCRRMNYCGWVRNLSDGSVEITVDLKGTDTGEFIEIVKRNSPGEVEEVSVTDIPDENCRSFEIRF